MTGIDYERLYAYRLRHVDQERRQAVWNEIATYVYRRMGSPARVLDPGAGRCEFINAIPAAERWVVDMMDNDDYRDPGVKAVTGSVLDAQLPADHFDGVFVSNMLEHLPTQDVVGTVLGRLHSWMAPGGTLAVIGPNFRYCSSEYFDCADHTIALTHIAVAEHLHAAGFDVRAVIPRFLPYSFRSLLPASPALTRNYLRMPVMWRLLGKQFLLLATKPDARVLASRTMGGVRFRGARWHPPAPGFPVPRRSDARTIPPLTFLPVPGYGPEHVVVDARGRLLTGLADGKIVRVSPGGAPAVEIIADTGGRPLGMELAGDDTLGVGDAERGLLRVRPVEPGASVAVLCNTVGGERLVFCSCPAIAADGTIYFSQSSRRYDLAHYKGDLLEHSGTGRVLRYRDGQVDVIADGLHFANGLVLTQDESSLIVAETGGYRVTRIRLDGEDGAAVTEPVIENLPGFPDNLTAGPSGLIWIAMASPRDATLDLLLPRPPWLRAAVWSLPDRLKPAPKDMAWVLAIDSSGRVVHDLRGWHVGYHEVTAVREHDGVLYLASIEEAKLARAELPS